MNVQKTKNRNILSLTQESWQASAKRVSKTQFIPFINERDGLGRLLPIESSKSPQLMPRKQDSEAHPMLRSYKRKFFEAEESQRKQASAPKLTCLKVSLQNYLSRNQNNRSRDAFFDDTDVMSKLGETALLSPKPVQILNDGSVKVLYKRMPNYSFSKSVKKTVIEETIEKCRNKDLDFIDVSRAHDLLHRRLSYVPEYSKMSRPKNTQDHKRDLSHGYLMKILTFQDKENIARHLIRKSAFLLGH